MIEYVGGMDTSKYFQIHLHNHLHPPTSADIKIYDSPHQIHPDLRTPSFLHLHPPSPPCRYSTSTAIPGSPTNLASLEVKYTVSDHDGNSKESNLNSDQPSIIIFSH